jgi:DNA-binding GntR family transcriptional regulator
MEDAAAPEPRRETAADLAYRQLRQEILRGRLPSGAKLTEAALADRLGISRTPVREALKRLALEGYVHREAGQGARVAAIPADEIAQIFQLRLMLESYAVRRACEFATADEIAALRGLAQEMSARTPPESEADLARLSAANERFHKGVMHAARSARLATMLSFAVDLAVVSRTYGMYSPRDLERSAAHHHEIVDALAAGDPDWAASVMTSHLLAAAAATRPDAPRARSA